MRPGRTGPLFAFLARVRDAASLSHRRQDSFSIFARLSYRKAGRPLVRVVVPGVASMARGSASIDIPGHARVLSWEATAALTRARDAVPSSSAPRSAWSRPA
jgi:hypothetical protein